MKTNLGEFFVKQGVHNSVQMRHTSSSFHLVQACAYVSHSCQGLLSNSQCAFSTNCFRKQIQSDGQLICFLPDFSDPWPRLYPGQSWAVAHPAWSVCCASCFAIFAALLLSRKPQIPLHQVGWGSQSKEKWVYGWFYFLPIVLELSANEKECTWMDTHEIGTSAFQMKSVIICKKNMQDHLIWLVHAILQP